MLVLGYLLLVVVLSYILGRAASFVSRSLHQLGQHFRTSDFIMGFVVLAVATSTPELAVALNSIWQGVPELSLGNLLGASIVILSLLVGLNALLAGKVSVHKFFKGGDFLLYLLLLTLPAVAVLDGRLSHLDGLMLLAAYLYFLLHLSSRRKEYPQQFKRPRQKTANLPRAIIKIAIAIAVLLVASYFLVGSAVTLAGLLSVSPLIIGLLVLSIGTNLPEFALVVTQARRGTRDIALGDLLGNVVVNMLILGLLALLSPFTLPLGSTILATAIFLLVVITLFGVFMWSKNMLTRKEGLALLAVYLLYAVKQLGIF